MTTGNGIKMDTSAHASTEGASGDAHAPLLLVVGSGAQHYREYILRSVSRHYRLWLLHSEPVTWQRPYLVGSSVVDTSNIELTVATAEAHARDRKIAGVLCYDEGLILPVAHVKEALGLTGMSPAVVTACRDKRATRVALDAAGVPQARSICVATYAQARAAAEQIGYPVVLKPRGLGGSKGVLLVDRPGALEAGYAAAREAHTPGVPVYEDGVLVEEYLDGPEISVDCVHFAGQGTPLVLARKRLGFDPFFEEVGHVVSASDPLLREPEIRGLLHACHAALGVRDGFTHSEIRLTSRGPRIIEVNGRLGGDLIPYLGWVASGIDAPMAAADVAAGRAPRIAATHSRIAAVRFMYPREDCQVLSISTNLNAAPRAVHMVETTVEPGAELRLPPRGYLSRYGFAITVGDTEQECVDALEGAERMFALRSRPLAMNEVTI
jgi:biotin carboxylase